MKSYEDIIIRPYITERTNEQAMEGKYTFMVAKKSTKIEISRLSKNCSMSRFLK